MTKREICERLAAEMEDCLITSGVAHAKGDLGMAKFCHSTAGKFRSLLLDLAAPEEEKHPGVIAKPGKDGEIEWCWCQKCYAQAAVVHDPFGDGENWSYCQKCGVSFRLKRGEGEK